MSPSSLVDKTPREGIHDNLVPFGGSVFKQIKEVQRKLLPAFAILQMPSAQNSQYAKAAYFGVACLKSPSGAEKCAFHSPKLSGVGAGTGSPPGDEVMLLRNPER